MFTVLLLATRRRKERDGCRQAAGAGDGEERREDGGLRL